MRGRLFVVLGSAVVLSSGCSITVTHEASGSPSTGAATVTASAPSPSPSPDLPEQPDWAARVEGKFRGSGLFTDAVTMVPRCRHGGKCDVVATSPKGSFKFDFAHKYYSGEDSVHETCSSGGYSTGYEISVQFKFHISRATYIGDEWRATALDVIERINSPGAKQTFTSATSINTLTCNGYHKKDHGSLVLAANH
jgi:hypothetical protein